MELEGDFSNDEYDDLLPPEDQEKARVFGRLGSAFVIAAWLSSGIFITATVVTTLMAIIGCGRRRLYLHNSIFIIRKHGQEQIRSEDHPRQAFLNNSTRSSRQPSLISTHSKASRLTLDEDLESLKSANLIFIRQAQPDAERLANLPSKYIILNTNGELMFYASETTDVDTRTQFRFNQPFSISVVNNQGEEVFDIDGYPGDKGFGAYVTVKRDQIVLGNVAQSSPLGPCYTPLPSTSLIEAPDGKTLQRICGQASWKTRLFPWIEGNDFVVYSPDGTICKAKICRQKNLISLEEYSEADTYALSFHTTDMDGKSKALLLAAVLMLDFQFFERNAKFNIKSFLLRSLLCLVLVIILIGGILLLISSAIDFEKERQGRFPGKIPSP